MDKQKNIQDLFEQAKNEPQVYSFEEAKEQFLSASTADFPKTDQHVRFTKNWKIMLSSVSIIGITIGLIVTFQRSSNQDLKVSEFQHVEKVETEIKPVLPQSKEGKNVAPQKNQKSKWKDQVELEIVPKTTIFESLSFTSDLQNEKDHVKITAKLADEPYEFPKLTEEEIQLTAKKKKAMLKALMKVDKNSYTFSASGSFDYNGETVACQSFFISQTEVSNFEYRTFLFDLLIQGRKEEFLKAKPDQNQWKLFEDGRLASFTDSYFSNKSYNDYPVVNISREGAELYCKWFSEELQKFAGEKQGKLIQQVRIPYRVEWVKAASAHGAKLPYPWGGPFVRDSKGFVLANHTLDQKEVERFSLDTTRMDVLAPVKSFWPNVGGMYNLSGNVAEMVYDNIDKSRPGTAGGSWRNSSEEIKIYGPDPYKGITDPKPTIGFRIVMTYLRP